MQFKVKLFRKGKEKKTKPSGKQNPSHIKRRGGRILGIKCVRRDRTEERLEVG